MFILLDARYYSVCAKSWFISFFNCKFPALPINISSSFFLLCVWYLLRILRCWYAYIFITFNLLRRWYCCKFCFFYSISFFLNSGIELFAFASLLTNFKLFSRSSCDCCCLFILLRIRSRCCVGPIPDANPLLLTWLKDLKCDRVLSFWVFR